MTDNADNDRDKDRTEDREPPAAKSGDEAPGDAGIKRALDSERKARREAERQAREARERADELEHAELLSDVIAERNLTREQAAFLTGGTREELLASADALVAAFRTDDASGRRRPVERLRPGGVPNVDASDTAHQAAEKALRSW
jgi:hypothetical protein